MAVYNGNLVKNSQLSVEQLSDVKKSIIVSLRSKEKFWDKFCSHDKVGDGYNFYEWRKLNVNKLSVSEISNLTEGQTPDALSMTYVNFKVSPVDFGTYIEYTDKAKKYNFDNVVSDAKIVLAQHAFDSTEIRKGQEFVSGTCTMSLTANNVTNHFLKDLLKARTILKKNNVKPISNNKYGCILPPEVAAEVLIDYSTSITHTSQKESLINGYLGELGGFILYENADEVMYKAVYTQTSDVALNNAKTYYTKSGNVYTAVELPDVDDIATYYEKSWKGYVLFIGKTEYGMPVRTIAFGDASVHIFDSGLGEGSPQVEFSDGGITAVKGDPLHQRGTVGYKVMGFATNILFDEAIIRGEYAIDGVNSLAIVDSNRDNYTATATSPSA